MHSPIKPIIAVTDPGQRPGPLFSFGPKPRHPPPLPRIGLRHSDTSLWPIDMAIGARRTGQGCVHFMFLSEQFHQYAIRFKNYLPDPNRMVVSQG